MIKTEILKEFMENMIEDYFEQYKRTKEYEYFRNRLLNIDEMLDSNLTSDEKYMIDEILFEIEAEKENYAMKLYYQGYKERIVLIF